MNKKLKKIIVAPLNWGLGHATRCIPVIYALLENNFTPIIASDGKALAFLQKEFPDLEFLKLPSYNITYGKNLRLNLLLQTPKIIQAVRNEKKVLDKFITKNKDVVGVISDNRFGVCNKKVISVYITHQVTVLSGFSTFLTSKIHQNIIKKFDECWIPDNQNSLFSGKLSEAKKNNLNLKFIGVLSRFKPKKTIKKIDVLAIISGIESQRVSLVKKLKYELSSLDKNIVLIEGIIAEKQTIQKERNITVYNFMLSNELENAINSAKLVICRSGYSSVMDLAVLQQKAFFIPTKRQTEQEYLASFLESKKLAPFSSEENFNIKMLENVRNYSGLSSKETELSTDLFSLFKRK